MRSIVAAVFAIVFSAAEATAQVPANPSNLPICGSFNMSSPPTPISIPTPRTPPPGAPSGSVPPASSPSGPIEPCIYVPGTGWTGQVGTFGDPARVTITGPSLIVPAGAVAELPSQRWEFDRVEIQRGAILRVTPGGLSPFHLVVKGSMVLHGTIEARNFDTAEITHTGTDPSGAPIRFEFKNDNLGGNGAFGGNDGARSGGAGAAGTNRFGGGGGSGAVNWSGRAPPPFSRDGLPAAGDRGGEPLPLCGRRGGDGGHRAAIGNGGLILLRIDGDLDAGGGVIDLRGSDGVAGGNGVPGGAPGWDACQAGGGGGGGGAPGGQGGYLLGVIRGRILEYPTVRTAGGAGGRGGSPGGGPGEEGRSGNVHWFNPRP